MKRFYSGNRVKTRSKCPRTEKLMKMAQQSLENEDFPVMQKDSDLIPESPLTQEQIQIVDDMQNNYSFLLDSNSDDSVQDPSYVPSPNSVVSTPNSDVPLQNIDVMFYTGIPSAKCDSVIPNADFPSPNIDDVSPTDVNFPPTNTDVPFQKTDATLQNTSVPSPKSNNVFPKANIPLPNTDDVSPTSTVIPPTNTDVPFQSINVTLQNISLPSPKDLLRNTDFPSLKFHALSPTNTDDTPSRIADVLFTNTDIPPTNTDVSLHNVYLQSQNSGIPPPKVDASSLNTNISPKNTEGSLQSIEVPTQNIDIPFNNINVPLQVTDISVSPFVDPQKHQEVAGFPTTPSVDPHLSPLFENLIDTPSTSVSIQMLSPTASLGDTSTVAPKGKGSRWRKADPSNWKVNVEKNKKESCQEYVNQRKKIMQAKQPKVINCKCSYKCSENFSPEDRLNLCKFYWNLRIYERQKDFILTSITSEPVKSRRPRKQNAKLRKDCKKYYFKKGGEKIRVCAAFFAATLHISNRTILTAFENINEQGTFGGCDKRGKKTPHNKTPDDKVKKVEEHINSFPKVESHYTRKDTRRLYLEPGLTITKMYDLYKEECVKNNEPPVSQITYRRIFCTKFNLSFHRPKKDLCMTCTSFDSATEEEKSKLKEDHEAHLKRKNDAAKQTNEDMKRSEEDKHFMSSSFDLQAILQIPKANESVVYYLRKLNLYNLTIYEEKPPKNGYCYVWTEIDGKKGSCEIGTCLYKYLTQISKEIKEIVLYSDTCGGQNRNVQVAALMLHIVQTTDIDIIEHKFFESGHSHMNADSMHSAIEFESRHKKVVSPHQWIEIMENARSTRGRNKNPPYIVTRLLHEDFLDLKSLATQMIQNKSLNENNDIVNWLKVKCFRYEKSLPNKILYKYDYNSPYQIFDVRRKRRARTKDAEDAEIGDILKLYQEPLAITKEKLKDLKTLCEKKVIPPELHPWFTNLPTTSSN